MKDFLTRRAVIFLWGPIWGFAAGNLILGPEGLIAVLNAILFALAAAVVVAFAPNALDVIRGRTPLGGQWMLVMGICVAWLGTDVGRAWNIVWRLLGQPLWIANSPFNALGLFLLCYGAVCHLYADEVLDQNRIPARRWVRLGIIVGGILFTIIVASYAVDRYMEAGLFEPMRTG